MITPFADVGYIALLLALVVTVYSAVAAIVGQQVPALLTSAYRGVGAVATLVSVAVLALWVGLLGHDFTVRYVAETSSRTMDPLALISALWGGQAGSLLFWAWTQALLTAVVLWRSRARYPALLPVITATLLAVQAFFLFLLALVVNPFARVPLAPDDGRGLNPLLLDVGMRIHPPLLLTGYMSFVVPFAFAVAALVTGDLSRTWLTAVRRWTLLAWAIQAAGLLMGAWWAYHVLGWGGYWGWDPVENCAIMPWLTGTAFLHSIQIQERRGTLKIWNMALVTLTFCLAIFGTFIVRSGVLQSVHAFALSTIGPYYFAFLAIVAVVSVALLFWRMPALRAERDLDSLVSREAAFLLNNLLFIAVTFAIFWGTIFPLISEAVREVKVSVGAPYFQMVNGPILLGIVLLMGIGPLLPWRRATRRQLGKAFLVPIGIALALTAILFAVGLREAPAVVGVFCCLFVAATIVAEFVHGARARRSGLGEGYATAIYGLLRRNGRRYGGYLIHLGIVALALGVLGSQVYQQERQVTLAPGQTAQVGAYTVRLDDRVEYTENDKRVDEARLTILSGDRVIGAMRPNKSFYRGFENQATTSVAIRTTPREDLYIVLNTWDSRSATMLLVVNPLVVWIWIGGLIVLIGTIFTMWPRPVPVAVTAAAPARGGAMAYGD